MRWGRPGPSERRLPSRGAPAGGRGERQSRRAGLYQVAAGVGRLGCREFQTIRTLALLTIFRGAKRGASNPRNLAASGHVQPLALRPNGTSGCTGPHSTAFRECLSSRSRVRVAVGAQVNDHLSLLISSIGHLLRSTGRKQSLVSGHFAVSGNVRRRPATGEMREGSRRPRNPLPGHPGRPGVAVPASAGKTMAEGPTGRASSGQYGGQFGRRCRVW